MIYSWKTGTRIKADATLAAELFDQLAEENRLNAESVVEVSKPADAVLHGEFEWDDTLAATEWRKHQARNIINALVITEESPKVQPVRYAFQIEENTSNYTPLSVIMQSADSVEALKRKALSELLAFKMKYSTIIKKCGGENEINSLQMKMENIGA
jgi:hypothetical protein